MTENDALTKSLPEKRPNSGRFQKGQCPNPKGRGKGNLSKTTRFLQILTPARQTRALKVLDETLKDAEKGDPDARKLVLEILKPFIKREAERDGGGGDKRPLVNINVVSADGKKPQARVIDGTTGAVDV